MRARRVCAVVLALVAVVAVGCTSGAHDATSTPSGPPARVYWPTEAWRTDDPAEHGFDAAELAEVDRLATEAYPGMRSVVIVRDGYVVHEYYRQGLDAADGHDVRSVTKSVVSALVGIALADGAIESLDATVGDLLARHLPPAADPRMANVTLRQLLSMTSGLAGDDGSVGGDDRLMDALFDSPDWVQHILGRPLVAEPGTDWAYSSATSHLLSAIVADSTGQSTLQFARDRLFGPLGIRTDDAFEPVLGPVIDQAELDRYLQAPVAWPVDPQGYPFGGAFLRLPARDLAKIGYLYLNEGRWNGEEIIPADYIRASTTGAEGTPNAEAGYGWQWWLDDADGHPAYFARGYGGQTIHVVPDLDLVTVTTSDPGRPGPDGRSFADTAVVLAAED